MDGKSLSQGAKVYFRINLFNGAVPIDITQTTVSLFVVTVIVVIIGIWLGRNLTKKPSRRQALVEKIVMTLYNLVESTMGKHNLKYAPYVGTIFISSLFGTLIGLTKVFRSTTADMMVIMGWSLLTSFLCWFEGIRNKGFFGWLKSYAEPVAFIAPINIVSEVAQPLAMTFRHFGNIAGGGVLMSIVYAALASLSGLLFKAVPASIASAMPPVFQVGIPAVLSLYFDLFSGLMQAFVFSLLTMVYIAQANPAPVPAAAGAKAKKSKMKKEKKAAALKSQTSPKPSSDPADSGRSQAKSQANL